MADLDESSQMAGVEESTIGDEQFGAGSGGEETRNDIDSTIDVTKATMDQEETINVTRVEDEQTVEITKGEHEIKHELESAKALKEKDHEEELKNAEMMEQAKRELDDWYVKYNERIAKIKEENRDLQKEQPQEILTTDTDDASSTNPDWRKIVKLCGFKTSRGVRDTTRMKSILLELGSSDQSQVKQQS